MTTTDVHSLVAPYALDALDDAERTRFEDHLATCDDCREELAGFAETAALLGAAASHAPPPALRARLLTEITHTPQERPVVTALAQRRGLRRQLPRLAVAAAVLVAAVGVGGYVVERDHAQDEHARNQAITSVLSAADAATVAKTFPGGGSVKLISSDSADAAVVLAKNLPAPGQGKVYQVWMIDADGPVSQGVFETHGEMVMTGVSKADSVAVTVEPRGGSKQPTTPPVATVPI